MENKRPEQMVMYKIPLKNFIDALRSIWETGADYIDLIGRAGEKSDEIDLVVKPEYMSSNSENEENEPEFESEMDLGEEEEEDDVPPTTIITKKNLSDDDLNSLI